MADRNYRTEKALGDNKRVDKKQKKEEKMNEEKMNERNDQDRLVGMNLETSGFKVKPMTEVYTTNEIGIKTGSLGFFKSEKIAIGFANLQTDACYHKTEKHFVLTNGIEGFILGKAITILEDEKAALEIRETALKKLTAAEREALGV